MSLDNSEITEKILERSRDLETILNSFFLKEFAKFHNIKDKYNLFSLKQEVIAKRGYFLDVKKKYALWIINKEGVPVEEAEIKGLITKRSDYSAATKVGIRMIIDMLIKDEKISFEKIRRFVTEYRKEILKMIMSGDKSVGRPVSFSKSPKEYKRLPSHVLGMYLWNDLMYYHFAPKSKGSQFKIKGIDLFLAPDHIKDKVSKYDFKKYNNIVIPYDYDDPLPKYISIDVEGMIRFAWDDRVREILGPISYNIFNEQTNSEISVW